MLFFSLYFITLVVVAIRADITIYLAGPYTITQIDNSVCSYSSSCKIDGLFFQNFDIFPKNEPIFIDNGLQVASNVDDLLVNPTYAKYLVDLHWTGMDSLGNRTKHNCINWSSSDECDLSYVRFSENSTIPMRCNLSFKVLCACVGTTIGPTKSPTTSLPSVSPTTSLPSQTPSVSPTKFPTQTPTKSPIPRSQSVHWKLRCAPGRYLGGQFGGFTGAQSICKNVFGSDGTGGTHKTVAFFWDGSTSIGGYGKYGIDPSTSRIYNNGNGYIGNLPTLVSSSYGSPLLQNLNTDCTVGGLTGFTWTNFEYTQRVLAGSKTCNNWASSDGNLNGIGKTNSPFIQSLSPESLRCDSYGHIMCLVQMQEEELARPLQNTHYAYQVVTHPTAYDGVSFGRFQGATEKCRVVTPRERFSISPFFSTLYNRVLDRDRGPIFDVDTDLFNSQKQRIGSVSSIFTSPTLLYGIAPENCQFVWFGLDALNDRANPDCIDWRDASPVGSYSGTVLNTCLTTNFRTTQVCTSSLRFLCIRQVIRLGNGNISW